MSHRIRIEITPESKGTRVWLDGAWIDCSAVVVRAAVGEESMVTLIVPVDEVEITGAVGKATKRPGT